jgi:hypothetical protein
MGKATLTWMRTYAVWSGTGSGTTGCLLIQSGTDNTSWDISYRFGMTTTATVLAK